ncbi:MAG TPA: ABC transporter ATP-binding protein [Bacteroidales bacterium]|nr:ABC transporter ATP-binding protein [Bacteroidales bacterium]HOL97334.1 ABC transporter ATP-binding protein [Bacteroidales bacterium]HOM36959.1 ABC transporter ATP-binding protein [Bacteroidales bacterium]HPD22900.1 ABC transporter ATP-binding protein [Bacteroidales bacterium]HRS98567.1 ABC transporter ATP-binding protein [Bacteroidales bacterium]
MVSLIELNNVIKHYVVGPNVVRALQGISFNIKKNEYVAIMGPSGSGKSTLMNILGCLDTVSSGKYVLNGIDVSDMSDNELADIRNKEIGFVFQTFNLLPRYTAFDNVMLPLIYAGVKSGERIERTSQVIAAVGLAERSHHRPNELSGGQRQRVAIARALINNPSIILADEPTGNLDTKTSVEIMEIFEQIYQKGNTIIVVTHEDEIARYARRIIRLRDGLIESDTINEKPILI